MEYLALCSSDSENFHALFLPDLIITECLVFNSPLPANELPKYSLLSKAADKIAMFLTSLAIVSLFTTASYVIADGIDF